MVTLFQLRCANGCQWVVDKCARRTWMKSSRQMQKGDRAGWCRQVHVKTESAVKWLCLLNKLFLHRPHHIRDFDYFHIFPLPKLAEV